MKLNQDSGILDWLVKLITGISAQSRSTYM